jgi:N-acetylglutamate synthase
MLSWPALGTRVTIRYRRPAGSVPPLTDAVGHLLAVDPVVLVQTKTGAVVEFAPADVVALRVLTDAPVRTSTIRALEHAAAAGWPGVEQAWLDGWLLRAGYGATFAANSAVPLDISAHTDTISAIAAWYAHRDLTPRLAIPDRLLRPPPGLPSEREEQVLVRDVSLREPDDSADSHAGVTLGAITLSARPDDAWLRLYQQHVPADVLTAVMDGELTFGRDPGVAVARAAVTDAPDGSRWVGLSAIRTAGNQRRPASRLCEELLAWGARSGATRSYMRVADHDTETIALAEALGFRLHHRNRYLPAHSVTWDTV